MKIYILIITVFAILFAISCKNSTNGTTNNTLLTDSTEIKKIIPHRNDTIIAQKYDCCFIVSTIIDYPEKDIEIKGTILMLHGWNLPATEWCEKTSFCEKALAEGYVLIIPDYNKSNYALELYPQTRADYQKYPTITWMMDFQIPYFQETFGLLKPGQNNLVAGISTGARGATLLAYYHPEIFKGAASLSGDFDITAMQDEFLYYAFFGQYSDFPERWRNECFAYDCQNYKVPLYIGHGESDNVSPVIQSKAMYDSIKKYQPELKLIGNFPSAAGHNYDYWESETDNVLDFFRCCK